MNFPTKSEVSWTGCAWRGGKNFEHVVEGFLNVSFVILESQWEHNIGT